MQFERLKIQGFKSFVDVSEFVIERGLTGVVGPNGCGKSNLVEAMRWVMGESSYKAMRASGTPASPASDPASSRPSWVVMARSGRRPFRSLPQTM